MEGVVSMCVQVGGARSEVENTGQFSNKVNVMMGLLKLLLLTPEIKCAARPH